MKLLLLLILLIFTLSTCTKNDDFGYASYLTSTKIKVTSYPRVFTKTGEITNKTVVDTYINNGSGNFFFLTSDTILTVPIDTIAFISKDTILFPSLGDLWGKRVIRENGNYLFLYMTDTFPLFHDAHVLDNIAENIGIAKPYIRNCASGFGGPCWVYDAFVAQGNGRILELPLLTYKITRRTNYLNASKARKFSKNVFDPSVLSILEVGDTLAIQTGKLTYSSN